MGWNGDEKAIHDDIASEIFALTEKATPGPADLLLIEDVAASNVKKKVQIDNLPGGASAGASGEGNPTYLSGFGEDNLAASLTNSQLYRVIQGVQAQIPVVVSHAGAIIGLSVASSEARTAGTATFEVYLDGVATGLQAVLNGTDTQYVFAVQSGNLDTFAAGARLDVRVTTDGSWAPITADVEASIIVADEGSLFAGWSPILDYKTVVDTPDDEFDSATLDGKWTAVTGAIGNVSLLETGEVQKYDLTTRPGWLLMQAGSAAGQKVEVRQDFTLGDGDSIIIAMSFVSSSDGDTGIGTTEQRTGISLNDNDANWDAGEYNTIMFQAHNNSMRVLHWDGSTTHGSTTTGAGSALGVPVGEVFYLRFHRVGSVLHAFVSGDGSSWMALGSETRSATATNIWIFMESQAAASEPVPITAVDWIRQGTSGLDPWTHSGLVAVAEVEDWTAFTPTLEAVTTNPTIGNGNFTAKYKRVGTAVTVKYSFKFGSTSAAGSGAWQFRGLPYSVAGVAESTIEHVGSAWLEDSGTALHVGAVRTLGADDIRVYTDSGEVAHNAPFVWATDDQIHLQITYETDAL